jgi:8-amino-7-oxononanoate synthase
LTATSPAFARLEAALAKRRAGGLARQRRIVASPCGPHLVVDGVPMLAFASNDYLGLAADPSLAAAAREAAARWGVGAGASPLVCGHCVPHEELEEELAEYVAPCEDAQGLTFATGYAANVAILATLARRGDTVFADRLNHASLIDGAELARADHVRYAHGNAEALAALLARAGSGGKVIATDAVFSMDGDLAPLPRLLELAQAHDAWLVVDDAHGFGVLGEGRGSLAHCGISSERIVYMGTLGKAAGVAGAFVAAHPLVIATLRETARPYVYSTAPPAMLAQALRVALAHVRDAQPRRAHLAALIARFRAGALDLPWRLLPSVTPIQPLVVGDASAALRLADRLQAAGIWVPAIRPPTVPQGTARLRVSLSAAHTVADVDRLISALRDIALAG